MLDHLFKLDACYVDEKLDVDLHQHNLDVDT